MPNWTKEQSLAIYESGKNIIVSAGAGSGKTAVLSERVLKKIENGVDIDRLLILTFTTSLSEIAWGFECLFINRKVFYPKINSTPSINSSMLSMVLIVWRNLAE